MHIAVVTTNDGKFKEFEAALHDESITLGRVSSGYPEIQADSLEEVVRFALEWLRVRVEGDLIIDDSGLFIEGLGGFPGVYSAYVERTIGLGGVLRLMEGCETRKAQFRTVVGYLHEASAHLVKGVCDGEIASGMKGHQGFGYDPIFIPSGDDRTFGEMTVSEKNGVSHRGNALRQLGPVIEKELRSR